MPSPASDSVTELLAAAGRGDSSASERLFPVIYEQLRALATHYLAAQRHGHTLQPTALVHEAYLKLVGVESGDANRDGEADDVSGERRWRDRGHFFAVAATAMRHVLVNHAKARGRLKRGGDGVRIPLDDALAVVEARAIDLIALDEALDRLAIFDPVQVRIVELRFFAGLTVEETARALEIPVRTVERDWAIARRWLRAELSCGVETDDS